MNLAVEPWGAKNGHLLPACILALFSALSTFFLIFFLSVCLFKILFIQERENPAKEHEQAGREGEGDMWEAEGGREAGSRLSREMKQHRTPSLHPGIMT